MTRPASRHYTRWKIPLMRGMSCSMSTADAASPFWYVLISIANASISRWTIPAVDSSRYSTLALRASSDGYLCHLALGQVFAFGDAPNDGMSGSHLNGAIHCSERLVNR